MTGIHSTRLAASKAHRRFVAGTRKSVQKMGWEIPNVMDISPTIVGAQPLGFPVPPTFERAFGYRRFALLGARVFRQISAIRLLRWRRRHTFGRELVALVSAPSCNFYTCARE